VVTALTGVRAGLVLAVGGVLALRLQLTAALPRYRMKPTRGCIGEP